MAALTEGKEELMEGRQMAAANWGKWQLLTLMVHRKQLEGATQQTLTWRQLVSTKRKGTRAGRALGFQKKKWGKGREQELSKVLHKGLTFVGCFVFCYGVRV